MSGDGGKMYADGFERIRDCSQNELNGYSDISASLLILPLARSTGADFIFLRPFVWKVP